MPIPYHTFYRWNNDAIAEWERAAPSPEDDAQARIAVISPIIAAPANCAEAIPSWNADTPDHTWIEIQLRAQIDGQWTNWYRMGLWDSAHQRSKRTSINDQHDEMARVATDTLSFLRAPSHLQARVLLYATGGELPELNELALCLSPEHAWSVDDPIAYAERDTALNLPTLRAQYAYPEEQGWCSPTSLSMVFAYWHERLGKADLAVFHEARSLPEIAAPMVYDPAYDGTGNWAFNTAYATTLGLSAYFTRMHSLDQLARWIEVGVPVVLSLAWGVGELDGTPIAKASGHLIVITGFSGDRVLVADPAASDASGVARSYRADQLFRCWQRHSGGSVYLIFPPDWPIPTPHPYDAWA